MEKIEGPGGIECYLIRHESGSELTVARHGGHAISWKTSDGVERLYLSPIADYSSNKAIRGGVPVIFPQFSDHGPYGRHGFARKTEWGADPANQRLVLSTSPSSREAWPHEFSLSLTFDPGPDHLEMIFSVTNTGDGAFEFHAALHTYLIVDDLLGSTAVSGLGSLPFLNEATGQMETGGDEPIPFGTEIDRAYFNAGSQPVTLTQADAKVRVDSEVFPDVVVWNPGPGHDIGDLPEDGWKNFVCIESAQVGRRHLLEPHESWIARQILTTS